LKDYRQPARPILRDCGESLSPQGFRVGAQRDESADARCDGLPVLSVCHPEPRVRRRQYPAPCSPALDERTDGSWNVPFTIVLVVVLAQKFDPLIVQLCEQRWFESPHTHGYGFIASEPPDDSSGVSVDRTLAVFLDLRDLGDTSKTAVGTDVTNASGDWAEVRKRATKCESHHRVVLGL